MSKRTTLLNGPRNSSPPPGPKWRAVLGEILQFNNQWTPRTAEDWEKDIWRFLFWLQDRMLNRENIESYLQEMRDNGGSDWLIVRHKVRIKWLTNNLVRMGYMKISPTVHARFNKKNCRNKKRGYTFEEYRKIRDSATPEISMLATILFSTGMSLVDGALLQWEHVDLKSMMIRKHRHKMRNKIAGDCRIPIIEGSDFHRLLLRQRKAVVEINLHDYVFPELVKQYYRKNGEPHREDKRGKSLVDLLRIECKRIGVEHLGTHSFRRGLITELVSRKDANLIKIMEISGHSSLDKLQDYVRVSDESIRDESTEQLRKYFTERHVEVQNGAEIRHETKLP